MGEAVHKPTYVVWAPVAEKFEAVLLGVRLVTIFSDGVVAGKANETH